MPPIAHQTVDENGVRLIREWIESMEGEPALPPPKINASRGANGKAVVTIEHPDLRAIVRYTLDGLPPNSHSTQYSKPLIIAPPATIRARAYKEGFKRSITAQATVVSEPENGQSF
jgi:hypothetical protein